MTTFKLAACFFGLAGVSVLASCMHNVTTTPSVSSEPTRTFMPSISSEPTMIVSVAPKKGKEQKQGKVNKQDKPMKMIVKDL